jgi:isopentenyl diphosphate isomerase/L-lactate dehydrogenase-like FMN-dependent dehydrogenase
MIEMREAAAASIPLIMKGIMMAEDVILAIKAGADRIMTMSHGERHLDGCLASIEIAAAVKDRVPIFLDSGIRRGTDILKAFTLGATAVEVVVKIWFCICRIC